MRRPKIAVFDSGAGGLTVLEAIQRRLPKAQYFLGMDTLNFPYGSKSEDFLAGVICAFVRPFLQETKADILVIACGTASTMILPILRESNSLPIVGVVPAIKPAAQKTRTGAIALLATPGTVVRPYTRDLIEKYAKNCEVILHGSRKLVQWGEDKLIGLPIPAAELQEEIAPIYAGPIGACVDTVVLGCTHFPLLIDEMQAVSPRPIQWVDSGDAIASRVVTLLKEAGDLDLTEGSEQQLPGNGIRLAQDGIIYQSALTEELARSHEKWMGQFGFSKVRPLVPR